MTCIARLHTLPELRLKNWLTRWWIGLTVILIIAGAIRFSGYSFGLPYFQDHDEPWFYYEAAYQRGLLSWWDHPNPSQGLIGLYTLAQMRDESLSGQSALNRPMQVVLTMRILSVLASLTTLIFIGLCARELGGDLAGWLAAGLWAIIPLVVYHSLIALAEPWMMCLGALTLYLGVLSLRRNALKYPVLSVWAGLLGFTFKYSMFSFAGVGVAVVLWRLWTAWKDPDQRRHWLRGLMAQGASIAVFLAAMVAFGGLGHDVSSPAREVGRFITNPFSGFTKPGLVPHVIETAFLQLGTTPLLYAILFIAALTVLYRQNPSRQNWKIAAWVIIGALGIFNMLLVPFYLLYEVTLRRYLFSADLSFTILAAASLSVVLKAIYQRVNQRVGQRRIVVVAAAVLIAVWISPLAVQTFADAVERTKPYTLTDLTVWSSYTMGEGSVLAELSGYEAFAHEFGGNTGIHRIAKYGPDPLSKSPEEWQKDGYRFLEVTTDYDQQLRQSPGGEAYMQQLLELRRFPAPESKQAWTGPSFIMYQFQRPQQPFDVVFGKSIRLVGSDGLQISAHPGETLSLRFYWQAINTPHDNYSAFVHMTASGDRTKLIAQADGSPAYVQRPTVTWTLPSETLVSEPFKLAIPYNVSTGTYDLWIGLYNPFNGKRLTTGTDDSVLLSTVTVTP